MALMQCSECCLVAKGAGESTRLLAANPHMTLEEPAMWGTQRGPAGGSRSLELPCGHVADISVRETTLRAATKALRVESFALLYKYAAQMLLLRRGGDEMRDFLRERERVVMQAAHLDSQADRASALDGAPVWRHD